MKDGDSLFIRDITGDHVQKGSKGWSQSIVVRTSRRSRYSTNSSTGLVNEKMINQTLFFQVQYRMHPCLSAFPSNIFYEGSLQNGVTEGSLLF